MWELGGEGRNLRAATLGAAAGGEQMADEQGDGSNVVQFRRRPESPVRRRMELDAIIIDWSPGSRRAGHVPYEVARALDEYFNSDAPLRFRT